LEEKEISQAVIGRLPRYFRYLGELKDEGVERISSQDLSALMKVTASQIRQDFNNFGGFGQQGYGYNVEYLYNEIGKILGLDRQHNYIIIGAGNLGRALGNYLNFEKRGFILRGLFDQNPALVGSMVRGIEVMPMEEMERRWKEEWERYREYTKLQRGADPSQDQRGSCGREAYGDPNPRDLEFCPCGFGHAGENSGGECPSFRQSYEIVLQYQQI